MFFASRTQPEHDFDAAYDQVETLLETHQYDVAAELLQANIEPKLEFATEEEHGRFFALAADTLFLKMAYEDVENPDLSRTVAMRYERADAMHFELSPQRIERWADSSLLLGDLTSARARLTTLEVLSIDEELGPAARQSRNRVQRKIVDYSLHEEELPFDSAFAILRDYRENPNLSLADEIWAVARQAAFRLEDDRVREAIDHLQMDMRRLEPRMAEQAAGGGSGGDAHFGELYALLARGYDRLGQFEFAAEQAEQALKLYDPLDAGVADALVILGRIRLAQSDFDAALEAFSRGVADFEGTHGYLPALLGRAEVFGRARPAR